MTEEDTNAVIERVDSGVIERMERNLANAANEGMIFCCRVKQSDLRELIRLARIGVSLEGEGVESAIKLAMDA